MGNNGITNYKDDNGKWMGYLHFSVNHKKNFCNPLNPKINTQKIEATWRPLKERCKRRGYRTGVNSSMDGRIAEF
jgi:hypothetical protein